MPNCVFHAYGRRTASTGTPWTTPATINGRRACLPPHSTTTGTAAVCALCGECPEERGLDKVGLLGRESVKLEGEVVGQIAG
jgi:hypothetical protein